MPDIRRRLRCILLLALIVLSCLLPSRLYAQPAQPPRPSPADMTISDLITQLLGPDWLASRQASDELVNRGSPAAVALVNSFSAPMNLERRSVILNTLERMPDTAAPLLTAVLTGSTRTAAQALSAIGLSRIGPVGATELSTVAISGTQGQEIAIAALPYLGDLGASTMAQLAASPQTVPGSAVIELAYALSGQGEAPLAAQKLFFDYQGIDTQESIISKTLTNTAATSTLLVAILNDEALTTPVRQAAAKVLTDDPVHPVEAVPPLIALVLDSNKPTEIRMAAMQILGSYGTTASAAVPLLKTLVFSDANPLAAPAAAALGEIGIGQPDIVAMLAARLEHCTPVAAGAAAGLGSMGAGAQAAVDKLVAALQCKPAQEASSTQAAAQRTAAQLAEAAALGHIGLATPPVIAALTGLLINSSSGPEQAELTRAAAQALADLGPAATPILAGALLDNRGTVVHSAAADALATQGVAAAPALIQVLLHHGASTDTQQAAGRALANIGSPVLPYLIQAMRQDGRPERQRLVAVLDLLDESAFAGYLAARNAHLYVNLNGLDQDFNIVKFDELGNLRNRSVAFPEALPYLIAVAQDPTMTPTVHLQAISLIGWIGPPAAAGAPILAAALASEDPAERCEAARALPHLGAASSAAATTVAKILDVTAADTLCAPRPRVEREKAVLLKPLLIDVLRQAKSPAAVPSLVRALAVPQVRRQAAEALGATGAVAHPALLDVLATNPDDDVRRSAAYALYLSTDPWSPALGGKLADIARNPADNQYVRAMLAVGFAAQGRPLPGIWRDLGMDDPTTRDCSSEPRVEWQGEIRALGYDVYLDACMYGPGRSAPLWEDLIAWWHKTMN